MSLKEIQADSEVKELVAAAQEFQAARSKVRWETIFKLYVVVIGGTTAAFSAKFIHDFIENATEYGWQNFDAYDFIAVLLVDLIVMFMLHLANEIKNDHFYQGQPAAKYHTQTKERWQAARTKFPLLLTQDKYLDHLETSLITSHMKQKDGASNTRSPYSAKRR